MEPAVRTHSLHRRRGLTTRPRSQECEERLAQSQQVVVYTLLGREGMEHEPVFSVSARLSRPAGRKGDAGGEAQELAKGQGRTKKAAEQDAARRALERLDAAPVKARS